MNDEEFADTTLDPINDLESQNLTPEDHKENNEHAQ